MPGKKYRKKPVEVDAIRFSIELDNVEDVAKFFEGNVEWNWEERNNVFQIKTLEGRMIAKPGDWIIRGVAGEYYPVRDDIFRTTYELYEGV